MRILLSTFFLLLISFTAQNTTAQTIAFKTKNVSVCEKNDKEKWSTWSDYVKAEIIITIDAKKDLIVVNSEEIQAYRINAYYDKFEKNNQSLVMFDCTDNNGSKCKIIVITYKKDNHKQIYINYNEVKFVYNISQMI